MHHVRQCRSRGNVGVVSCVVPGRISLVVAAGFSLYAIAGFSAIWGVDQGPDRPDDNTPHFYTLITILNTKIVSVYRRSGWIILSSGAMRLP